MSEAWATLIVRGNDWTASTLDGLSLVDVTDGVKTRGVTELAPGRHDLYCQTPKKRLHLGVVLFPGEVLVRKLDHETQTYILEDEAAEAQYMELALTGGMGIALLRASALRKAQRRAPPGPAPQAMLAHLCDAWNVLIRKSLSGAPADPLFMEAEQLGLGLSGLPMPGEVMATLSTFLHASIWPIAGAGRFREGVVLANLALRILPGHPQLIDLLAGLLSHVGATKDALALLEATMRRTPFLPAFLGDRLKVTYQEVVTRGANAPQ
jgi:hypothetical protein